MNASPTATALRHTRAPHGLALLAAACALALATAAAVAGEADPDSRSALVRYAPSELNDAAGAATVYARIGYAASRVCGRPHRLVLRDMAATAKCRADAIEGAVARAASPQLLAVHRKSTGQQPNRLAAADNAPQR